VNRSLSSHLIGIYGRATGHAKPCTALCVCVIALTLGVNVTAAKAQTSHIVRLAVDDEREVHRFVPGRLTVQAGDAILFRVSSGAPHAIAFESAGLSPAVQSLLQGALGDRTAELQGPVLSRNGMEYRFVVPRLPVGRYRFYSSPHRAYEMAGELIVQ
jgi:plastocyanin